MSDLFHFGKEEADKYGSIIKKELAGKVISKRKVDAENPGGVVYEAKKLSEKHNLKDFDCFTLIRALEGMCYKREANEIDDSHYQIKEISDHSSTIAEDIKHSLFDINDKAQPAADGTVHGLEWNTWCGDSHSFIINQDGVEYRVSVYKEEA